MMETKFLAVVNENSALASVIRAQTLLEGEMHNFFLDWQNLVLGVCGFAGKSQIHICSVLSWEIHLEKNKASHLSFKCGTVIYQEFNNKKET